jgi:hypothetical protein
MPEPDDFAYPGNPDMVEPFVGRTYFGGDEVFRLENVQWTGSSSLRFDVVVAPEGMGSAPNLVDNPSFEGGTTGWTGSAYLPASASFDWASIGANGSGHSASLASDVSNDVELFTEVDGLTPGRAFYLCGYLRVEDVVDGTGATMSISQTFTQTAGLHGTSDFTRVCTVVTDLGTTTNVACRLGGFGSTSSGQMWCDDVSLTPLEPVFSAP